MMDIVSVTTDIDLQDSEAPRASNLLAVQIGSLAYAPDVGIDMEYFLDPRFTFQNESFKAYLVQVLASHAINVTSVVETIQNLSATYTFNLNASESDASLIAR